MASKKQLQELRTTLTMDSDSFNRSSKETQADLRALRSEMSFVRSSGRDYERSMEGLSKQSDILNRQLRVQENQLEQVKKKYDESVKSTGENSKESRKLQAQYNNLAGQIRKTERQLESVNKEIDEQSNKWNKLRNNANKAGDVLQTAGQKMSGIGQGMTAGLTAPIAAAGIAVFHTANEFDKASGQIQADLGLTEEEAEKLNQTAQKLWEDGFGESMGDVAGKVAGITRSLGDLSEVDLSYVTAGLEVFENRGWADQQESLRAMRVLMEQFGMSAQESMDYLTRGFQENLNYSGEFLDTVSEYSTYFAELGFDADEMFAKLKSGADSGAFQLDKVGDAMKEFSVRAKDGSDASEDAFKALNLNADEMTEQFNEGGETAQKAFQKVVKALQNTDDETLRNTASVNLFGTQYEDLGEKAFDALLETTNGLEDVEGATKNASDALRDNFGTRATKIWRDFQSDMAPAGETLLEIAEDILPRAADAIGNVTEAFADLSPKTQDNIVKFAGIAAVAGPAAIALGGITTTLGGIFKVGGTVVSMLGKSGGAGLLGRIGLMGLTGGPVGLAVTTVGALSVGIAALTQASKDNIQETSNAIEKRHEEIESLDQTIGRYDELQSKNKLTTDEVLRYMDIMGELKSAKNEDTIATLTEEQDRLREKSGFTNEEMEEFLELNDQIVERSPSTVEAISEQGNAYADSAEAAKELNNAERERLTGETYVALTEQMGQQISNLKEQQEIQQNILDLESQKKEFNDNAIESQNRILEIDRELNTLDLEELGLSLEKREQRKKQIEELEAERSVHESILTHNTDELAIADQQIEKQQTKLEEVNSEIDAYNNMIGQYETMLLAEQNIVDEKGNAYNSIKDANAALHDQRMELNRQYNANEINTEEYEKQIGKINDQQAAINGVQDEADVLNDKLREEIEKNVGISTSPSISSLNRDLSSPITRIMNIQTYGATPIQANADGTDFHTGGLSWLGEEGPELVRIGNKWSMADFGLYDLQRGAQVFTHDESKDILRSLNRLPGYAEGISPPGEANRIINSLNGDAGRSNQVLLEQNRILMAILQSNKNIENKPLLSEGDIKRSYDKMDSRESMNQGIFAGRPGGV